MAMENPANTRRMSNWHGEYREPIQNLPIPHMEDSCRLHLEQFNLAWNTLHTQVLQRPVPVVIVKVTKLLKIVIYTLTICVICIFGSLAAACWNPNITEMW
jgi:hypothetical protein